MILTIRPATMSDARWIGAHLRMEDAREVETASGQSSELVVPKSLGLSSESYTIRLVNRHGRIDENPTVIFGIASHPTNPELGIVWLLGTSEIQRAPVSIIREAPKWLDHFNRLYSAGITNVVDIRNDLHIRWLTLTGFEFGDDIVINGHTFKHAMRFTREN